MRAIYLDVCVCLNGYVQCTISCVHGFVQCFILVESDELFCSAKPTTVSPNFVRVICKCQETEINPDRTYGRCDYFSVFSRAEEIVKLKCMKRFVLLRQFIRWDMATDFAKCIMRLNKSTGTYLEKLCTF